MTPLAPKAASSQEEPPGSSADYFFGGVAGGLLPRPLPDSLPVVLGPFGGRGAAFDFGIEISSYFPRQWVGDRWRE